MTTLHIFTANQTKRFRRKCPYHKKLEYGTRGDYYDTVHWNFDCGTFVDAGYGEWTPPPKSKCPKCRKWFRPLEMKEHLKADHAQSELAK